MPFIFDIPGIKYPSTQQVGDDEWVLLRPFWHVGKRGRVTFIPPGGIDGISSPEWTTDYRSGPELPSLPKQGHYSAAWLKHDWLYSTEAVPRRQADWELLQDLQDLGATWYQRNRVWLAVRAGGFFVWRKHDPAEVKRLREWGAKCAEIFKMPKP